VRGALLDTMLRGPYGWPGCALQFAGWLPSRPAPPPLRFPGGGRRCRVSRPLRGPFVVVRVPALLSPHSSEWAHRDSNLEPKGGRFVRPYHLSPVKNCWVEREGEGKWGRGGAWRRGEGDGDGDRKGAGDRSPRPLATKIPGQKWC